MLKKRIATGLIISMVSSQLFSYTAMASGTVSMIPEKSITVEKERTETVKLYRKTSKSPGEESKRFNIAFHTNEPLGLEVMEETEIEILIEGEGITGSANLNLHDVNNLRGIQKINVGESTTVTIPRKGQLFLDVSNVKFLEDLNADFEINVTIKLNGQHYKVTPTYDLRDNQISDNVIQDEETFEATALSKDNAEDGTLLIGDNVRVYIPKSKYIPANFDASDVIDSHEEIIGTFNELAGLTDEDEDSINSPRQNFVLVSARNEQGGYMSAGGTMLDTLPQNMHEYLKNKWTQDVWGMYHEYGHMYEQGWGYVEYWNNIFANQLRRTVFGDNWAWIHGNKEAEYETNTIKPAYENYLKTGEKTGFHPMYYFLSFIDHYDSDYMANMETYYRENNISYGYVDYVVYFAAMNYGINIIPYMEASGHTITNTNLIEDVLANATSSFMYMPEGDAFDELRNISLPATMKSVYTGSNRVVTGMSNPFAKIQIQVNEESYVTTADENGQFSFDVPVEIQLDTVIKVTSTEEGKAPSIAKPVSLINRYNSIDFRGYKSETILNVAVDPETNTFIAESTGKQANVYYHTGQYFTLTHYNKRGKKLGTYNVGNTQTADAVAASLHGVSFKEGDYLTLHHAEKGRLIVTGEVVNAPYTLATGASQLDLNTSYFYIINQQLHYSSVPLEFDYDLEDLQEELKIANELVEAEYTKTSWANFAKTIEKATAITSNPLSTQEAIVDATNQMKSARAALRKINLVVFKGYNSDTFLTLGFDSETNTLQAQSSGKTIHSYIGSAEYVKLEWFNKKGQVKQTFTLRGNDKADQVAAALNGASYEYGDYFKLYHKEQGHRLAIQGYIDQAPADYTNGVGSLDLSTSYFYLTGESLQYSTMQLDLSDDKTELMNVLETVSQLVESDYTRATWNEFVLQRSKAESLVEEMNVTTEEIMLTVTQLQNTVDGLRKVNLIDFKGYETKTFLTIGFDTENRQFIAMANGRQANQYFGNQLYVTVEHYNKKGELINRYEIKGKETGDAVAEALNGTRYESGDYLQLSHREQTRRLAIQGFMINADAEYTDGVGALDLTTSRFYLGDESLEYSDVELELSADKSQLYDKVEELKQLDSKEYTATTYQSLQQVILDAEAMIQAMNVTDEEITQMLERLDETVGALRKVNVIKFKGYNSETFLSIALNTENNTLLATSNGKLAHTYIGNRVYATLEHYNKKGTLLGRYEVKGNQTADHVAQQLNGLSYNQGDFFKFKHEEQGHRFAIEGYVINATADYTQGVGSLDLSTGHFYLGEENLQYSDELLDLSADKTELEQLVNNLNKVTNMYYTNTSFQQFQEVLAVANEVVKAMNVAEEEIAEQMDKIYASLENLRMLNSIQIRGAKNEVIMSLDFNQESQVFQAKSYGHVANQGFGSAVYASVAHYNKKGELQGSYSIAGNQTADQLAAQLNNVSYEAGDYLQFSHAEASTRLRIFGYVENAPFDLELGLGTLPLNTSFFYLGGESMVYSSEMLDLSADKSELVATIQQVKESVGEESEYTKSTWATLQDVLSKAEQLNKAMNVDMSEIEEMISSLTSAKVQLRKVNTIEFKGYKNEIFLKVAFDMEEGKFIASSSGNTANVYQNGNTYVIIKHFNEAGELQTEYAMRANQNADQLASAMNGASFNQGDYITLYHLEQNSRLAIHGFVENANREFSTGVGSLDLTNVKFRLSGENLVLE